MQHYRQLHACIILSVVIIYRWHRLCCDVGVVIEFMDTYRVGQQQDAHEFLLKAIRQFHCDSRCAEIRLLYT